MSTSILNTWKSSIAANWISSSIGIIAGGMYVAAQAYKPGMTWHDWAVGAGIAILGLVVKDSTTHSTVEQVKQSTISQGEPLPISLENVPKPKESK
jgi:hypothetical protein